jgi:hypothetical protein
MYCAQHGVEGTGHLGVGVVRGVLAEPYTRPAWSQLAEIRGSSILFAPIHPDEEALLRGF